MVDTITGAAAKSPGPRLPRAIGIAAVALAAAVVPAVTIVMLGLTGAHGPTNQVLPSRNTVAYAPRTPRLDATDWVVVENAIRLRAMALAPGRTALYRSFAAYMGLSGLITLQPVKPGRCAIAVSYLYDNLLDLHDAYSGEDWRPLRRLIRKQPPLSDCSPKTAPRVTYVG